LPQHPESTPATNHLSTRLAKRVLVRFSRTGSGRVRLPHSGFPSIAACKRAFAWPRSGYLKSVLHLCNGRRLRNLSIGRWPLRGPVDLVVRYYRQETATRSVYTLSASSRGVMAGVIFANSNWPFLFEEVNTQPLDTIFGYESVRGRG